MAKSGRKPGSVKRRPQTSPAAIAITQKHAQALELRIAGAGFQSIADALGYSTAQGAFEAVKSALKATLQEPADELRRVDLERLEKMLLSIWPQVRAGNHGAIDRAVRILERRARLLGLDVARLELSGPEGGPIQLQPVIESVRAKLQRLAEGDDQPG